MFKLVELHRGGHRAARGDRRHNPRHQIGWPSLYVVSHEFQQFAYRPQSAQAQCIVHDLSITGAGLELSGRELAVGEGLVLDLQLDGQRRASIRLTGEIRHTRTEQDGVVRVGIEFVAVGDLERALLLRLLRAQGIQARRTG